MEHRIESHFDGANGLPPSGHPDEYAAAFEAVFPSEVDRRAYIDSAVTKGVPSFGHRVLGSLLASGQTHCVFTTNFDHLVERCTALAEELLPGPRATALAVAAIDSADRAERCLNESAWPLLVKLHGDYQSVKLKNTATELRKQDETLRTAFVNACNRFGLIVVGYSGRDSSVMEALTEALEGPSPFPAGLRWVVRGGNPPLEAVTQLMELATAKGVETEFVDAETFDELAADIDRQASFQAELSKHVREHRPILLAQPVDWLCRYLSVPWSAILVLIFWMGVAATNPSEPLVGRLVQVLIQVGALGLFARKHRTAFGLAFGCIFFVGVEIAVLFSRQVAGSFYG